MLGELSAIDDPGDERLLDYRVLSDRLLRQRVEADKAIFVVEGKLAVRQLLYSNVRVRSLLVDDHQACSAVDLVDAVRERGAPVYVGSRAVVAATVGFALHRGVVAIADRPAPILASKLVSNVCGESDPGGRRRFVAVLEGINDHENLGALFRNAAAFGARAVFLDPTCADPLYRRSVRVSMGNVLHVPFARVKSLASFLEELRDAGFVLAALAPHPENFGRARREPVLRIGELTTAVQELASGVTGEQLRVAPIALLLGSEGRGLSEASIQAADMVVSIAMSAAVDSLNVATAAAIAFHRLSDP